MAIDKKNAHIRSTSRRQSSEVKAEGANRILNDPAFTESFTDLRENIIKAIENSEVYDGSPESENYLLEQCRHLVVLKNIKGMMTRRIQGERLRVAEFKPKTPEKDND